MRRASERSESWSRWWFQTDDEWHSATFNLGDDAPTLSDCRHLLLTGLTYFWLAPDNEPLSQREPPFPTHALCADCRAARILMA